MNEITADSGEIKISPEALEVATTYLECADIKVTAEVLGIPAEKVSYYLDKKEVKRFVDSVFLDQGYLNRHKLQETMTYLIDLKMEELKDAEVGSSKDILDLLQAAHKMRMEEIKAMQNADKDSSPRVVVNTNGGLAPQFGDNYDSLLGKLMKGG